MKVKIIVFAGLQGCNPAFFFAFFIGFSKKAVYLQRYRDGSDHHAGAAETAHDILRAIFFALYE